MAKVNRQTESQTPAQTEPKVPPQMFKLNDPSIPVKIGTCLMNSTNISLKPFVVTVCGRTLMLHTEIVNLHSEKLCKRLVGSNILSTLLPGNFVELCQIKQYMYTGQLEILRSHLIAFNDIVTQLNFKSLMSAIATGITFESSDELLEALNKAINSDNTYMEQVAFDEFAHTFNKIPMKKVLSFVHVLSTNLMELLLKAEEVHGTSESELRLALTFNQWLRSDREVTSDECKKLLTHIKFDLISASDLITKIRPLGLLKDDAYIALLEKIGLKSCEEKSFDKGIFICNVADPIPNGYRIVTNEEFNTDQFKKNLGSQIQSGMKCIGNKQSNGAYLVLQSRETVTYDGNNYNLVMQNGRYYRFSVSTHASFSFANHGNSDNDAYLCIRQ